MRLAIAVLAAALLLVGTQSRAQDAAGTIDNKAAAAEAGTVPVEPAVRPPAEPKPRTQFLLDMLNELVRPRPAPVADSAAPAPSGAVPPGGSTVPVPAGPAAAGTVTVPGGVPRDVKAEPSPVAPRPVAAIEPVPDVPAVAEPAGAAIDSPAAPPPAPTGPPQLAAEETDAADATTAQAGPFRGAIGWPLLALLVAAAGVASALHLRRTRRIARTRAALALEPRFDLSAGACAFTGLSLACPPLAIRTRLDLGETRGG